MGIAMQESLSKLKDFFSNPKQYLIPLLIAIPILAIAVALFLKMDSSYAKAWDKKWGFWFILSSLITATLALIYNAKDFYTKLTKNLPSTNSWLALFAILIFFGVFAQTQIDLQHRVLSDENSWESMGLQMYHHQSGGVCNQGWYSPDTKDLTCTDEVNNFKGKATGLVYWVMFHFMEPTRDSALQVNFIFYLLSIIFIFWAAYNFLKDEWLALAIATVLAGTPILLLQSMSASTEVLYILLLCIITLFMSIIKPKDLRWKHLAFLIPIIGIFAQTRQETVFCILPIVFYYHPFFRKKEINLAAFTALVILCSWPIINTIIAYRGYDFQGGEHSAQSMTNFFYNIKSNFKIMMSLDQPRDGILSSPFYTTYTIMLLAGTIWLVARAIATKKYVWGIFLSIFFHIQTFMILINVSGTFEIGINQRYVLIALPNFALIIGLFVFDVFNIKKIKNKLPASPGLISFIICAIIFISLSLYHKESFNKNMLYRNNKLLTEENFLNTYLKENTPANSIFIYSRPWQMLCSGFNGYSEDQLLRWSETKFEKQNKFSNGNIYLVRGQDGYGKVNRKSRVVGFKTTTKIERILAKYENKKILSTAKEFGYPLEVFKIISLKKENPYIKKVNANFYQFDYKQGDSLTIDFVKSINDSIKISITTPGFNQHIDTLNQAREQIKLAIPDSINGLVESNITFTFPDNSKHSTTYTWFLSNGKSIIATKLPYTKIHQDWGNLGINKSVDNNPITINKRSFKFGFGTHANSTIKFNLDSKYKYFYSHLGLDDEQSCGDGATFKILGDKKTLFISKHLFAHELDSIKIDVNNVKELLLISEQIGNNKCDHTNWANPWLN